MKHENTKARKKNQIPRTKFQVGFWNLVLGIWFLLAFGCGLADYQDKFARQQERVNYLDQENEYLAPPIQLSRKKEGNPNLLFFFRPPLEIATSPDDERTGVLLHYSKVRSGKGSKDSSAKLSAVQDVYLAVTINKSWPDFKSEVLASLKSTEGRAGNETVSPPGREPITFETFSFTEGAEPTINYRVYFFRDEIYRVAIAFRGPQNGMNSELTQQAIQFSLGSLVVGDAQKR